MTLYWRIITILSHADILLHILFGRVLFAAVVLSVLIVLIMLVRKNNLAPVIRSYLWMLCIPALFIPFERSAVIIMQGQVLDLYEVFPNLVITEWFPILYMLPTYIWVIGFVVCAVKTYRSARKRYNYLCWAR